jgi:hypothetical protein
MIIGDQVFVGPEPDSEQIEPIENVTGRSKPRGGFWTCQYQPKHLSEFIKYERGGLVQPFQDVWRLEVDQTAEILYLESEDELKRQPSVTGPSERYTYLDFETIFEEYDCVYVSGDLARSKSFSRDYSLRGWDFETYLWEDLSQFTSVEHVGTVEDLVSSVG